MSIRRIFACSFAIVVTITQTIAFGQNPTNPAPAQQDELLRITTAVVQTEAIVTDKSGNRITGLKASDFAVLDEGKPQGLDFFTAIEGSRLREGGAITSPAATSAANTTNPAGPTSPLTVAYEGRYLVLVFDDLNLTRENFLRSRRAFADYINTKLTPTDMVALVSTGGALASLQQFTNDKQLLLSGLSRIAARNTTASSGVRPWGMTDDEALRIDKGDQNALRTVRKRAEAEGSDSGPTGTIGSSENGFGGPGQSKPVNQDGLGSGDTSFINNRIQTFAKAIVSEVTRNSRSNIETLKSIFKGMSDLPGRKIVVLMTEAFGTAGGSSEDLNSELTQLIEVARRGGISVYALDAAGLRTDASTASEHLTGTTLVVKNASPDLSLSNFEQLSAARKLVAGTGGELIANTNSLISGLDRAIQDSSSYYVIGFKPAMLDNKFHRLAITIKDRPNLIVRTRRGYIASNPETVAGTETELVLALKSPVGANDLPVELVANVVPRADKQVVQVGLHVWRNYLSLPGETVADQVASYDVMEWVFSAGRDNPVGALVKRPLSFDLAKDPDARRKLKSEGILLVKEYTDLTPGMYQVRAVIREKSTGAVGSAYQFFEIPDAKNAKVLSMSSVLLSPEGQMTFSGQNRFKAGSQMDLRFLLYNQPKVTTGIEQRVKLIDAQGKILMDSPLPLAVAAPGSPQDQSVQATRLLVPAVRGHYALVITVQGDKGKIDMERRADFIVE